MPVVHLIFLKKKIITNQNDKRTKKDIKTIIKFYLIQFLISLEQMSLVNYCTP